MIPGARHIAFDAKRVPYIMPDGSSYWDSGFVAGAGCEYVVDCLWISYPRVTNKDVTLLCDKTYTTGCATPCTFNYSARRNRDALTTQVGQAETHNFDIAGRKNVRSVLRIKHQVSGNSFSIGFDGGTFASGSTSNSLTSTGTLKICYANGGYSDNAVMMLANTVKIFGLNMFRNGVLEKSFRPAMKHGRPCLYDSVARAYHYSLGTTDGVFGYLD